MIVSLIVATGRRFPSPLVALVYLLAAHHRNVSRSHDKILQNCYSMVKRAEQILCILQIGKMVFGIIRTCKNEVSQHARLTTHLELTVTNKIAQSSHQSSFVICILVMNLNAIIGNAKTLIMIDARTDLLPCHGCGTPLQISVWVMVVETRKISFESNRERNVILIRSVTLHELRTQAPI